MLKYVLLGVLNYSAMNGYELKQFMDGSTAHFWHAKYSQIYTTLKTLEEEKLLTSELHPQEHRPDRRVYTITEAGKADLRNWLSTPDTTLEPTKKTLLVRLFFAGQLDKDTIITQLKIQQSLYQQLLQTYRTDTVAQIEQTSADMPELVNDMLLWDATRRLGEMTAKLYIQWLSETIAIIESKFLPPKDKQGE